MALKNYTSQISARNSISYIEDKLARCGANRISKDYSIDGKCISIAFIIKVDGIDIPVKLPARIKECESVLRADVRRPNSETNKRIAEQAERTAWKIVYDWVEVQMAMIELAQVEFMEVFLPYVYDKTNDKTFFQAIKEKGFQRLLPESLNTNSKVSVVSVNSVAINK